MELEHPLDVSSSGVPAIDLREVSVQMVSVYVERLDVVGAVANQDMTA